MGEVTGIAWTHSTFNPWVGCTKVSPGCDACYAEQNRFVLAKGIKWGVGEPRHRTSATNWKHPLSWNRKAAHAGRRHLVFCASLADVFDAEVPDAWRGDLFDLIEHTPALTWQLVTKRIGLAQRMVPSHWRTAWPRNVWAIASIVDRLEAERDMRKLLRIPAVVRGVSYEPALGPVDFSPWLGPQCSAGSVPGPHGVGGVMCEQCGGSRWIGGCPGLQWVIVGGESAQGGQAARPFDLVWARSTVQRCSKADVPVFVKQLGSRPIDSNFPDPLLRDRAGADPSEWPCYLQVQEFPA